MQCNNIKSHCSSWSVCQQVLYVCFLTLSTFLLSLPHTFEPSVEVRSETYSYLPCICFLLLPFPLPDRDITLSLLGLVVCVWDLPTHSSLEGTFCASCPQSEVMSKPNLASVMANFQKLEKLPPPTVQYLYHVKSVVWVWKYRGDHNIMFPRINLLAVRKLYLIEPNILNHTTEKQISGYSAQGRLIK